MPDCGAVTRAIAFGGKPLADELRVLGAAREDDAVTIGDGEHAAGQESRSGLPEPRQVFRQAAEIEAGDQHAAAIRIHRGERQGERQEATADTGRGRKAAGREARGSDGIPDPLRPIASARPSAGSDAQISLPSASSSATNANIGTLCWIARSRSPQAGVRVTHLIQLRDGGEQRARALRDAVDVAVQQLRLLQRQFA